MKNLNFKKLHFRKGASFAFGEALFKAFPYHNPHPLGMENGIWWEQLERPNFSIEVGMSSDGKYYARDQVFNTFDEMVNYVRSVEGLAGQTLGGNLSLRKQAKFDQLTIQTSDIPDNIIDALKNIQKNIPKDILYIDQDEKGWIKNGLQTFFHVTILFGVNKNVGEKLEKIVSGYSPISITTDELHYFEPDEKYSVAVLKCKSDELTKLHKELKKNLENEHTHKFTPHITIAYLKKGERIKDFDLKPIEWVINNVDKSNPNGSVDKVKIGSKLSLLKQAGDWNPQYAEDMPGANTGMAHPVRPYDNFGHNSILEREPEESRGGGERVAVPGAGDDDPWGESNYLRPLRRHPLNDPRSIYPQFNTGFDTEEVQRQFGGLNLRRQKTAELEDVYDNSAIRVYSTDGSLTEVYSPSGEVLASIKLDLHKEAAMAVPIRESLDYPHSFNKKKKKKRKVKMDPMMDSNTLSLRKTAGICAWCKSEYGEDGQPARKLTDEEYSAVESHGLCQKCKAEQQADLEKYKQNKLAFRKASLIPEGGSGIGITQQEIYSLYSQVNKGRYDEKAIDEVFYGMLTAAESILASSKDSRYIFPLYQKIVSNLQNTVNKSSQEKFVEIDKIVHLWHEGNPVAVHLLNDMKWPNDSDTDEVGIEQYLLKLKDLEKFIENLPGHTHISDEDTGTDPDYPGRTYTPYNTYSSKLSLRKKTADSAPFHVVVELETDMRNYYKKMRNVGGDIFNWETEATLENEMGWQDMPTDDYVSESMNLVPFDTVYLALQETIGGVGYLMPLQQIDHAQIKYEVINANQAKQLTKNLEQLFTSMNVPHTTRIIHAAGNHAGQEDVTDMVMTDSFPELPKGMPPGIATRTINWIKKTALNFRKSLSFHKTSATFDGKEYTDCTGMGLSGSMGAGFECIRRDDKTWVPSNRYQELKALMKDIKNELKTSQANILDLPNSELDPGIWTKGDQELPLLRPEVKRIIIERFFEYLRTYGGYKEPEIWVKNMFYTGSTATYLFRPTSDIDIHIIVDWDTLSKSNPTKMHPDRNKMWEELTHVFWWTLNTEKLIGTKHPLTYYIARPGEEAKMLESSEEIYDIGRDVWLVSPMHVEVTEDIIAPAMEEASKIMHELDQYVSDAKRGLIDYDLLLGMLTNENAAEVYQNLEKKRDEVDKNLTEMKRIYRELKQNRNDAFNDGDPLVPGASHNYTMGNIIYKVVERYKYTDLLRKIKRIIDGHPMEHSDVPEVQKALNVTPEEVMTPPIEQPAEVPKVAEVQEEVIVKTAEEAIPEEPPVVEEVKETEPEKVELKINFESLASLPGKRLVLSAKGEEALAEMDAKQFTGNSNDVETVLLHLLQLIKEKAPNTAQLQVIVDTAIGSQGKELINKILDTWKWAEEDHPKEVKVEETPAEPENTKKASEIDSPVVPYPLETVEPPVVQAPVVPTAVQAAMAPRIAPTPAKKGKWRFKIQRNASDLIEDVIAEKIEE